MPPLTARSDPRQLSWLSDDLDHRPDLRARIDDWLRNACGHDTHRIVAANAMLKAHYHPGQKRCQCSEELLSRILRDLPDAFPIAERAAA
jgi:hypothetical protein